jgi:hypothetical protein
MQTRTHVMVLALAIVLSGAAVLADSKIEYKATEGGGASLTTILIGQGKARFDADANTTVIMDPAASASIMVDHAKKTFTRMGKAEIAQIADMMKQMEQALAGMPPEARQMMQGRMGGGPASTTVDTGEKATVAGKSCRIFRTTVQGRPTAENCMADASVIDLPAADRATMAAVMAWSKELTDAVGSGPLARVADSTPFKAGLVPVRSTIIAADGSRKTSEFVGVSNASISADMFAVPADYKEQKFEMPRGRGRGGAPGR